MVFGNHMLRNLVWTIPVLDFKPFWTLKYSKQGAQTVSYINWAVFAVADKKAAIETGLLKTETFFDHKGVVERLRGFFLIILVFLFII